MSLPLADNPDHLEQLCRALGLGERRGEITAVAGGFHHRMWRLQTSSGIYAIKQLAPDTDLSGGTANPLNRSERVAQAFADRGIPSLPALCAANHYLQVLGHQGYLVYPWTRARALPKAQLRESQCRVVAGLLARIHAADIEPPGLSWPPAPGLSVQDLQQAIDLAVRSNSRDASLLRENETEFEDLLLRQQEATALLRQCGTTLCHGDMDHKNVLWDARGEPVIIDWESARYLNPTYELLLEALDWSGITSEFRQPRFGAMLDAYRQAGGVVDELAVDPAFTAIQGEWLTWLLYNVGRAADRAHNETHSLGNQQIDLALSAILRLRRLVPRLRTLCQDV